jgi:hypothetical protein
MHIILVAHPRAKVASGGVIGLTNPWVSNKPNQNGANFLNC